MERGGQRLSVVVGMLIRSGQESPDPTLFATEVRNCAGATISLGVFCAKVGGSVILSRHDVVCVEYFPFYQF